jgi:hypothetical protein
MALLLCMTTRTTTELTLKQVSLPRSSVRMTDPGLPFCNCAGIFARYPVANARPVQAVSIVITTVATKSRVVVLVMPLYMPVELMLWVRTRYLAALWHVLRPISLCYEMADDAIVAPVTCH